MTNLKEKAQDKFILLYVELAGYLAGNEAFGKEHIADIMKRYEPKFLAFIEHYMDLAEKEMKKKCLNTVSGWCCACDYDIAVMEEKIKEARGGKNPPLKKHCINCEHYSQWGFQSGDCLLKTKPKDISQSCNKFKPKKKINPQLK
jgi:hypothetical protein